MSTIFDTAPDADESTDSHLVHEFTVEFSRGLDHRKDKPDLLRERFERHLVSGIGPTTDKSDIHVTVETFAPDVGAVIVVESDPNKDRVPIQRHIPARIRRQVRKYNQATRGDEIPKHNRVAIEAALENGERPRGTRVETWEKAKETAESLDLEGAPELGVNIYVRTRNGAPALVGGLRRDV